MNRPEIYIPRNIFEIFLDSCYFFGLISYGKKLVNRVWVEGLLEFFAKILCVASPLGDEIVYACQLGNPQGTLHFRQPPIISKRYKLVVLLTEIDYLL